MYRIKKHIIHIFGYHVSVLKQLTINTVVFDIKIIGKWIIGVRKLLRDLQTSQESQFTEDHTQS